LTISEQVLQRRGDRRPLDRVPLIVLLAATASAAMLVPATYAAVTGDLQTSRPFLYGGITFFVLSLLVGIASRGAPRPNQARELLLTLVAAFLALPVMLALPMVEAVPGLSFRNAYFEMVSSITTTGATVFELPSTIAPAVHLWRALVGWMGGFLLWVAAIAILAPLRLGGFELVLENSRPGRDAPQGRAQATVYPMRRILRHAGKLAPIYGGLTLVLWLCLLVAGEVPLVAACHAFSTLATSGITPLANPAQAQAGLAGEAVVLFFMVFALSRATFTSDMPTPLDRRLWQEPELRLAAAMIVSVPLIVFFHHWIAGYEGQGGGSPQGALRALWGSLFTTVSFLTTTGFVSSEWASARLWSGLNTPGLILMGLALVGGGVATTAGGVKLLRVYALYKHGQLELARLVHPHAVASPGHPLRRISQNSAYLAWLFFMLFALSIAACMLALSLAGAGFDAALVLTIAALSNTGPLTFVAADAPIPLGNLPATVQIVTCAAMVLGRLETLAIIALLNPDFWRA
jgi:trk system potassium uptake protein TrkH